MKNTDDRRKILRTGRFNNSLLQRTENYMLFSIPEPENV
jgi:hypothetical protein